MRVFHIQGEQFAELDAVPEALPSAGFLWIGSARREFEVGSAELQAALQRWTGGQIVDLHVLDLLNNQLPSHFDYTSWYDLMVFRRLAPGAGSEAMFVDESRGTVASARKALQAIDTSPVGFAIFDRVLITVHPTDCAVRDYFVQRLFAQATAAETRGIAETLTWGASTGVMAMALAPTTAAVPAIICERRESCISNSFGRVGQC
jgi:hypothetical protein